MVPHNVVGDGVASEGCRNHGKDDNPKLIVDVVLVHIEEEDALAC